MSRSTSKKLAAIAGALALSASAAGTAGPAAAAPLRLNRTSHWMHRMDQPRAAERSAALTPCRRGTCQIRFP
jgi:hypothetical protein